MDAAHAADESARQIVQDRSLIDHLVSTFHAEGPDDGPAAEPAAAVYNLIKREWPENLTLGTRL